MPRLFPPDRDALESDERQWYDHVVRTRGRVSGPFTLLLHSPKLGARVADVGCSVRFESSLPRRVISMVALQVARAVECDFEWAVWAAAAPENGLDAVVIRAVDEGREPIGAGPDLEAAFTFARELLAPGRRVTDSSYADAIEQFGIRGVVELTATLGYLSFLSFPLNAFELEPPETDHGS